MFEIMYELPARNDIAECVITREFIEGKAPPTFINNKKRA
jgi:ATP-dependent protease Clp ATPase subunit